MRCSKLVFFTIACMVLSTLYVQNVEAGKKKLLKGVLGAGLVLAALKPKIVPLPLPLPLLPPPPPPEEALAHYHHVDLAALHHAGFHHGGYHAALHHGALYDLPHAHAHAHHISADYHHGHHYPLW